MDTMTCADVAREELVPRYVAGRLESRERETFEEHLVTCDRCQENVRLAVAVRDAVASAPAAVTPITQRSWLPVAGLAAAAAIAALIVLPRLGGESEAERLGRVTQPPIWMGVEVRAEPAADGDVLFEEAMELYEEERWDEAVDALDDALEASADPVPTAFFLGAARLLADRPGDAVEAFDVVIARGDTPYLPEARYYRAKALLRLERTDAALADLEAAAASGGTIGGMSTALADSVRALGSR